MSFIKTTAEINYDIGYLSISRLKEQVGCITKVGGMKQVADSVFIQKQDLLDLLAYPGRYNIGGRDALYLVAHSPEALGMHVISWGVELSGDDMLREIWFKQKYPYEHLFGLRIVYDQKDLVEGEVRLMMGTPGGDQQAVGGIKTRWK